MVLNESQQLLESLTLHLCLKYFWKQTVEKDQELSNKEFLNKCNSSCRPTGTCIFVNCNVQACGFWQVSFKFAQRTITPSYFPFIVLVKNAQLTFCRHEKKRESTRKRNLWTSPFEWIEGHEQESTQGNLKRMKTWPTIRSNMLRGLSTCHVNCYWHRILQTSLLAIMICSETKTLL